MIAIYIDFSVKYERTDCFLCCGQIRLFLYLIPTSSAVCRNENNWPTVCNISGGNGLAHGTPTIMDPSRLESDMSHSAQLGATCRTRNFWNGRSFWLFRGKYKYKTVIRPKIKLQSRTDRARKRTFCSLRFPCPLSSLNTHVRTDKARARQMSNIYTQWAMRLAQQLN